MTRDGAPAVTIEPADVLHARGYRCTPQRLEVLAAVQHLRHGTPEQIHARVQSEGTPMNLSTVYRVLEVLEEVELVRHAHIGSGAPTYHAMSSAPHLHFTCGSCGEVQSLPAKVADGFVAEVERLLGFHSDVAHTGIYGLCARCSEDA